jgi:FKBP-type peptidyl-prolyl cis-trans isomerase FkpA
MIKKLLNVLMIVAVLFSACEKETRTLKEIEDEIIKTYISKNNLTGFIKDTSGFYYQIVTQGTGIDVKYSTFISFSQKTTSINTNVSYENSIYIPISNYAGYISPIAWRESVIKAKKGAVVRIITPSYLAFGKNGFSTTIPGNAILDTKITIANDTDRPAYEDALIRDFLTANNITAQKDPSGLYYQILSPGTGLTPLTTSTVKVGYTGRLLTGFVFDQATTASPLSIPLTSVIQGWQTGVPLIKQGGKIRLFIPSRFGYGTSGSGGSIPGNSILDFDIELIEVTN